MLAVVLKNLSKNYFLINERPILLKAFFAKQKRKKVWALKNLSLTIKKGKTLGIIGENGSGKSTLLKIISGITPPTKGKVEVNGRVGSLIELGAGFLPDLTGKENVYLNGALLGFSKYELDQKYSEICKFADIGEFINQPLRTYSSGMVVRLGFAVAANLDPDVLLIDEVLAVGDEGFQRKCIEKINEFKSLNKTILFVSHNLALVENLCQKTIVLKEGKIIYKGSTQKAIRAYTKLLRKSETPAKADLKRKTKEIKIDKVEILNSQKIPSKVLFSSESATIRIHFISAQETENPIFGIHIYNNNGYYCHGTTTLMKGKKIKKVMGKGYIDYEIEDLTLLENSGWTASPINKYFISAFLQSAISNIPTMLDSYKNAESFYVEQKGRVDQHGIAFLKASWSEVIRK